MNTRFLLRIGVLFVAGTMVVCIGCAKSSTSAYDLGSYAQDVARGRLMAAQGEAECHAYSGRYTDVHRGNMKSAVRPNALVRNACDLTGPVELGFARLASDGGPQDNAIANDIDNLSVPDAVEGRSQETEPSALSSEQSEAAPIERGPLPDFMDTVVRDVKESPRVLWEDTKAIYTNPWNVLFLVGAGGASLSLRFEVDDDIEDYYERKHTFKEDWRDAFGAMGNPGTHFALAGLWYLTGQQLQDAKTYEIGKRLFSALAINGLSTMALKVMANTESPNGEQYAWPSGHVSSTMTIATVLHHAYGPLVGVPMFGLTALVGIERLDSGEHSFSDLIFGAALGWVVAETVMKEHRPEVFGGEVVPYVDPVHGDAGLAWVKNLGN